MEQHSTNRTTSVMAEIHFLSVNIVHVKTCLKELLWGWEIMFVRQLADSRCSVSSTWCYYQVSQTRPPSRKLSYRLTYGKVMQSVLKPNWSCSWDELTSKQKTIILQLPLLNFHFISLLLSGRKLFWNAFCFALPCRGATGLGEKGWKKQERQSHSLISPPWIGWFREWRGWL